MAAKTLFMTDGLLGIWQALSEVSPGAEALSSPATGWTVGTNAPTRYKLFDSQAERSASSWTTSVRPVAGAVDAEGVSDALCAGPIEGTFEAGDWLFEFVVRAVTSGGDQDGGMNFRVFKGPNLDGSAATEITAAAQVGSAVTNLAAGGSQTSSATVAMPELVFDGEYLFVSLAWRITGAGGAADRDVLLRVGDTGTRITTTDFAGEIAPWEDFTGDFETGDTSQFPFTQAVPGRLTVVADPVLQGGHAGRFEVQDGDEEPDTGDQRCEVISGRLFNEGEDRYFRILCRIDSWDFDYWGLVWQIHDDGDAEPPLGLFVEEGALRLQHGDESVEYWEGPPPVLGEPFEVVVRVVFSTTVGVVEVWRSGVKQTLANDLETFDDADTLGIAPAFDKLGIYRSQDAADPAVVYHDDYRITEEFFSEPPVVPASAGGNVMCGRVDGLPLLGGRLVGA